MDKTIIMENIARQLELIVDQQTIIKAYSTKIPQIDMDIIKANIRKLYEQYYDLEKANLLINVEKAKEKKEEIPAVIEEIRETPEKPLIVVHEKPQTEGKPVITEKVVMEEKAIITEKLEIEEKLIIPTKPVIEVKAILMEQPLSMIVDENVEVIFAPEPKAIFEEKALEIREEPSPEEKPLPTPKTEHHIDLFGNAATIADRYKDDTKSLNERIQKNKTEKTYSSRMQHNAIKDLKSAIGINEKFLFINELFKGNMKEYNDSILRLNDFKSLTEAENFLEELKTRHKWPEDMVAYLTMKDFVERKQF